MRALMFALLLFASCGQRPAVCKTPEFRLKVGENYFIKVKDGQRTEGEYLGRRLINGKPFLVFRGVHALCKGDDGCWNKRNIAEAQVVEITPQKTDLTCERLWCTD